MKEKRQHKAVEQRLGNVSRSADPLDRSGLTTRLPQPNTAPHDGTNFHSESWTQLYAQPHFPTTLDNPYFPISVYPPDFPSIGPVWR